MSLLATASCRLYASEVFEEPPTKKMRFENNVSTASRQLPSYIELITPELEKSISELEYRIHPENVRVDKKITKAFKRCQAIQTNTCIYPDLAARFKNLQNLTSLKEPPDLIFKAMCEVNKVGIAQTIGWRAKMEDTVLVSPCTFQVKDEMQTALIMAVFDGHGGDEVAVHAQKNFQSFLQARLTEYSKKYVSRVAVWNALKISFVDVGRSIQSEDAGSTAAVCLKIGNQLFAANAGDSRMILITPDGKPISLSEDGSLELDHFARRVKKRGATIERDEKQQIRVLPEIAGGYTVNNAGGIGENCFGNSARPKIVSYTLPDDPTGYILLIASDGLWDVTTSDDIAAFVHTIRLDKAEMIGAAVVKRAYNTSGHDNTSVVIAKF
jgi:serine/threonine protein phosphatase PrpC